MDDNIDERKYRIIGAVSGLIGSLLGAIPIGALHYYLQDLMFSGRGVSIGGPYDLIDLVSFIFIGIPLPFMGIFVIPVGGVLLGMIVTNIFMKRYLASGEDIEKSIGKRLWIIGGISGILFNLFVSVWAQ